MQTIALMTGKISQSCAQIAMMEMINFQMGHLGLTISPLGSDDQSKWPTCHDCLSIPISLISQGRAQTTWV